MPVLPFHRYIGPGNKMDSGEPVDKDDRIALEHDLKYELAKTADQVRRADLEAIYMFRKDWLEGNWHSLIGDLGLSLKYFVESYTGVIYPEVSDIYVKFDEPCEVVYITKYFKLHCIYKKTLFEKFQDHPFKNKELNSHPFFKMKVIDMSSLLPPYLYVPINWIDLYLTSQIYTEVKPDISFPIEFRQLLVKKNVSRDSLRILTKYFNWKFYYNKFRNLDGNSVEFQIDSQANKLLLLFHEGRLFFDQDWNLHYY